MRAQAFAALLLLASLAAVRTQAAARAVPSPKPSPVETPAAMSAEDLLARWHAATGAERHPDDEREHWSIRVAGLEGTLEMLRHGADMQSETTLGPFRTARGTWHGLHWHQNDNGETILDRPEPSQTEKPVTQSVALVHEPLDAWELSTTFASGHVTRLYYDPHTFALIRSERTVAGHTSHTLYDDFRSDASGRTRAWHYFGGDDRPGNDFDYRLVHDDLAPAGAEAELGIPRDRRTLVEFPAGQDDVRLPARIENGRIYVRVDIAGRGLDFLLDTGCSTLSINETVARQLGLGIYGRTTQTVAGSFETGRVVVPALAIGELAMHDVVMRTVPLASNEARDTRVVGLLGFDFLDEVALKIDYGAGTVEAERPGSLSAPPGAETLDIRLNSGTPVARAAIADAVGEDFILDTGAAYSYVVFQRFARAHPEALASARRTVGYASGVGGTIETRAIDTKKVTLGGLSFDDGSGVEALSPNAFGFDNEDGLIGADILKQFTMYLDYAASRVYLAPSPRLQASATAPPRTATAGKPLLFSAPHKSAPEPASPAAPAAPDRPLDRR